MGWLRKNALIGGFLDFGWTVSSVAAAAVTFLSFVALGNRVTAERIFVAFALFDKVREMTGGAGFRIQNVWRFLTWGGD